MVASCVYLRAARVHACVRCGACACACVRACFTGLKADFSTANPTSAYDTSNFGKVRTLFAKSMRLFFARKVRIWPSLPVLLGASPKFGRVLCDDRNFYEAPKACPAVHRTTKKSVQRKAAESLLRKNASFCPALLHTQCVLELVCACVKLMKLQGGLFSLGISWRLWLQASIFNKDVLKNPKTGEGPEAAGKKTLEAAATADTYASRVRLRF